MSAEENELQLLLSHQVELESVVKGQDLDELVKLFEGYCLISADMKESFLSLECDQVWDERRQLRVRYLLQLVYEQVRRDKHSFDNLLQCLKDLKGEGKKVYDILCKERATGSVGEAGEVQDTERCLTEDDISELIGELASIAHKWEDICIALKIPIRVQADIRKEGGSSIVQLNKALCYWVLGDCLKPVTTSTLKQALAGPIVGVASIADKIPTIKRSPICNRPSGDLSSSDNTPKILFQSIDTQVTYGRSNLLEVEVSNASSSVSYQWYKDGHKLSDNIHSCEESDSGNYQGTKSSILVRHRNMASKGYKEDNLHDCEISDGKYQGSKSSILLVRHRNMSSKHIEGKYVCQVEGKIISKEISVIVHYPDRVKHLLSKYKIIVEEIPKDSWPPICAKSFVELALINRKSIDVGEYDYSVRGDMDDIIKKKDKIDYHQAFGRYESGALVLVEGRPGCGKTTLAHKVTRDWSRGEKVLVGAELVFLVSLRVLNVTLKGKNINELMKLFYCNKEDAKSMGQCLLSGQGDKVCFILDGLDEYHRKSNTFVKELISMKLPKAMVIIFSRPVGTWKLKQSETKIRNQIEILGLKKNQIHSYIDSYFDINTDMAHGLKEYLDLHINVLHMCYLPVHASMICYLFSQEGDNLPTTETQIYTQFTTSTITRKLMREDKSFKKITLANLSERNKFSLFEICKLAFIMTAKSIQVFHRSEKSVQLCDELGSDGPSLGLVTVDCAAKANGYEDFYSFLHLTFQEYLAAYFIFQSETKEQCDILIQYRNHKSMVQVWKFYCGLIGLESNSSFQNQINLIFTSDHANTLYRIQCAFESQQSISCDAVLDHTGDFILTFEGTINLADCNAICHVISKASRPTLGLKFSSFKLCTMSAVIKVFKSCTNLQTLDIRDNDIGSEGAAALAEALEFCTNLQTLDICFNYIGSAGAKALAKALKSCCTNLQTLDISFNNIDSEGAAALAEALKSCTMLQILDISNNEIGSAGAAALVEAFKSCTKLQKLDIRYNNIHAKGTAALVEAVKFHTNLQRLEFHYNNIGCTECSARRFMTGY